jgi:glycosyltransferase involved in cell wall biosynthesis
MRGKIVSTPDLAAILVTAGSFEPLRTTVQSLAAQTVRDRLELVIVCPAENSLGLVHAEVAAFHSVCVIGLGEITTSSAARVAGIRAASAPVVALCEDHAFPEPGWAEALIEAHKQSWAGVGPAFSNANPGVVSWATMVMDYGRWMEPVTGGVTDDIPGHNSSWKRSLLLEYGPRLEAMLPALTVLNWDLRAHGYELYLEPAAKVRHLQVSSISHCLVERFHVARLFPAERSRNWPWYRRLFYVCGMPVLLARKLRECLDHSRRIDPTGRTLAKAWPFLLLGIAVWGMGEIAGYSMGMGLAEERIIGYDTDRGRYVNRRDRELLAVLRSEGLVAWNRFP